MFTSIDSLILYLAEEKGLKDLKSYKNVIYFKNEVKNDLSKKGTRFYNANKIFNKIQTFKNKDSQEYIELLNNFLEYSPLDAYITFNKFLSEYELEQNIIFEKAIDIDGENFDIEKLYSILHRMPKSEVEEPSIRYGKFVNELKELAYKDKLRFDCDGNEHKFDEFYSGCMYLNSLAIYYFLIDTMPNCVEEKNIYKKKIDILDEIDKNQGIKPHFYTKYERLKCAYNNDQYFAFNEGVKNLIGESAIDYLYNNYSKITIDYDDNHIKEMIRRNIYFPYVFLNENDFSIHFVPVYDYEQSKFNEATQMCSFLGIVGKENNENYLSIKEEIIDHLPKSFIDTIGNYLYHDDNLINILKFIMDNKFYDFSYDEFYNKMPKKDEINYHELLDILVNLNVLNKIKEDNFKLVQEAYQILSSDKNDYKKAIDNNKKFCRTFKKQFESFINDISSFCDEKEEDKFKA